ncbi:helix-turn-helix protein [Herbihabitans rhizosphaerae]|uniref:Helix-turn-helix protein n=1 Tax=Herbihabitans rhizosphaerae TaxID=1872711 RepID=A0A4Q7L755_9PSEU|nr:helix-turn-helix transcriptional regulator [Herbihabitans rhizosphaerae]RZS45207.1 helix-turn-helix protein [Herbihabitans rhizosphaerae]
MTTRNDPSALRWLIGIELKRYRELADITLAEAGKRLSRTDAKISTMESGKYGQNPTEVARLLEFYGADPADIDRMVSLASKGDQRTWWAPWDDLVPDWLKTFVGLEGLAAEVFSYEPIAINALLQTEAYTAALVGSSPRVRADNTDRVVELRAERQRRLTDSENSLTLRAVIEESTLDRPVGGPKTMRTQLEHLLELNKLPNVDLRVIKTSVGVHAGHTGKFTLLGFTEFRDIGYVEMQEGAMYVQDDLQVRAYNRSAENLLGAALGQRDTASLISSRIKGLKT